MLVSDIKSDFTFGNEMIISESSEYSLANWMPW